MKKVSLLLGALMLVGGVTFATPKEKKDKKAAKTESCAKGGSCCSKKGAKADAKEDIKGKQVSQQGYKIERSTERLQTR